MLRRAGRVGAGALLDLLLLLLRVVVPVALAFSPEQAAGARAT